MDKKNIRKSILKIRNNMDINEKKRMDYIIEKKFLSSSEYLSSSNIFIYISYGSEINTKNIILTSIKNNKNIYVPRIDSKTKNMDAVKIISFDKLVMNAYGILEPSNNEEAIDPDKLDLIVVPGVAFDKNNGRMGYGAGYYDRYFYKISEKDYKRIKKVALAYDFQIIDKVPMNENDVPVDSIITTSNVIL